MGTSKQYNSVLVKDNCTLCLPTPYFQGRAILQCYLNLPLSTPVAIAIIQNLQNFASQPMKISQQYTSVPVIARCLHLPPYFWARAIRWSFKFLPCRPLLPWQQILGQNWL